MDADGMMRTVRNAGSDGSGWLHAWSSTAIACYAYYQQMGPMDARYVYGGLFLIGTFLAWLLRENPTLFFQRQRLSGCKGNRDCFAAEAVLMVSFSLFLFYFAMFLSTVYTTNVHGLRSKWHSKCWLAKIVLLASCFVMCIFAPTYVTQLYGKVAPFGAGLFLIVQLISVIRYITRLNSRWCGQNYNNNHRKVFMISRLAFGISTVGLISMVLLYLGCLVNIVLVVSTLFLVFILMFWISAFYQAGGFYMEPCLMGVYIVFLCWSAIKSEPETSSCYKNKNIGSSAYWITIISFIGGLMSITVAAFSTGTDYKRMQLSNVVESENDVPYGYGFFHFVFATGSMYFGELFLGWDTHHASEKWSVDVGWTSAFIHVANEGLVVIVFVALILARRFEIGWLEQLLGNGIGGQQLADATQPIRSEMDNNTLPPQESPTREHEGVEMGNNGPQQVPQSTEPVGTERDNTQPSSPSSSMPEPLHVSEPQAPALLGTPSEIEEEC